jgi:hypothetical protein
MNQIRISGIYQIHMKLGNIYEKILERLQSNGIDG